MAGIGRKRPERVEGHIVATASPWQSLVMADWTVVDLPSVFERKVRSYRTTDEGLEEIPDDGEWHRTVSEIHYLLAEFLASKGLLSDDVEVRRRPDLVIRHSQLTKRGKAFEMSQSIDKWMQSFDRRKPGAPITADGLERRWQKSEESHPAER